MQLPTLPSWMRQSLPRGLNSDSPFPPLMPDRRYRGVYERAGFDVNLESSGNLSPTLRQSPYPTPLPQQTKGFQNALLPKSSLQFTQKGRKLPLVTLPLKTPMSAPIGYPSFHSSPLYSPYETETRSKSARSSKPANLFANKYNDAYESDKFSNRDPNSSYSLHEDTFVGHNRAQSRSISENQSYHSKQDSKNLSNYLQLEAQQLLYQPFQPFQPTHRKDERLRNIISSDTSSSNDGHSEKNKKHLKLDIENSNFSANAGVFSTDSRSSDTYSHNSNSLYHANRALKSTEVQSNTGSHHGTHSRNNSSAHSITSVQTSELMPTSAPYPSKDYGHMYTPSSEKHLSHILADFRQDVAEHKICDSSENSPIHAQLNELQNDGPQNIGDQYNDPQLSQLNYYNHDHELEFNLNLGVNSMGNLSQGAGEEPNSSRDDLSLRNHLRDLDETGNTTVEDIPEMLHVLSNKRENGVNSRLSTISSILSKNDENRNEEEDEIERELERQLESLKTGSKASLGTSQNESFMTALDLPLGFSGTPAVFITGAESISSRGDLIGESLSSRALQEAVTPLFARQSSERFEDLTEPNTPRVGIPPSAGDVFDTPETIKPLSPQKHHVTLELMDLNIPLKDTAESELYGTNEHSIDNRLETSSEPIFDELSRSEEEILASNVPLEFDAFPRSVIDPDVPCFRSSIAKASPGTGSCRKCHDEVKQGSRGLTKAIFSRSGELSGQWHRGCFGCSYDNCGIMFNKQVTPYVLLDNPFCHHHYHLLNDTLCSLCAMGIEGECIENELKQKWHTHCLKCSRCSENITDDYFCVNNEIYCSKDASVLLEERKKLGLLTTDKVEKRRTRLMYLDQGPSF